MCVLSLLPVLGHERGHPVGDEHEDWKKEVYGRPVHCQERVLVYVVHFASAQAVPAAVYDAVASWRKER